MKLVVLALALGLASTGCAVARPLIAESDDLADYRAFRIAAREGPRLARAQHYLEAHPRGAWANEVRAIFDAEEPPYFEAATTSRAQALEYLADLPQGPHAHAAIVLLTVFDRRVEDEATAKMLREARRTEAMLERASVQRRAVGETILAWLAALLDEHVYGARTTEAPIALRHALAGAAHSTWGTLPSRHEEDVFFSLPSRPERESRVLALALVLTLDHDVIVEGRIEAPDLFVRWLEADTMRAFDADAAADRAAAAAHARELIGGALEASFPAAECASKNAGAARGSLMARECHDRVAVVRMGSAAGELDAIAISGRFPRK